MTCSCTIDGQRASPLFAVLPAEIREHIYAFYLTFHYSDFTFTARPFHTFSGERAEYCSRPLPALMLTCKKLYNELRPAVEGEAVLRACMFEHGKRVGFAARGRLRIPRVRRLVFHVAMEHANWNTWLGYFGYMMSAAQGLRELVVDWEPRRVQVQGRGYMATQERKMEGKFFEAIGLARELGVVRLYGDVPERWVELLGEAVGSSELQVVRRKGRWWRDDREDATLPYVDEVTVGGGSLDEYSFHGCL